MGSNEVVKTRVKILNFVKPLIQIRARLKNVVLIRRRRQVLNHAVKSLNAAALSDVVVLAHVKSFVFGGALNFSLDLPRPKLERRIFHRLKRKGNEIITRVI